MNVGLEENAKQKTQRQVSERGNGAGHNILEFFNSVSKYSK